MIARGLPTARLLRAPPAGVVAAGARARSPRHIVAIFIGAGLIIWALGAGDEQGLTPDGWDSSRAGAYAANFVAVAIRRPDRRGAHVPRRRHDAASLRYGAPVAVVVTALAFGLGPRAAARARRPRLLRVVTALLRLQTDSVYPCILVHSRVQRDEPDSGRHGLTATLFSPGARRDRPARRSRLHGFSQRRATRGHRDRHPGRRGRAAPRHADREPATPRRTPGISATAQRPRVRSSPTSTPPGRFVATVTATNAAGEVAQAQVVVTGSRRTLTPESAASARYGEPAVSRRVLRPAAAGARVQIYRGRTYVTSARVGANGRFRATAAPALSRGRTTPASERRDRPNVSSASARRSRRRCWATAVVGSTPDARARGSCRPEPARSPSACFLDGHRVLVRGRGTVKLPTGSAGHACGSSWSPSRAPATRRSARSSPRRSSCRRSRPARAARASLALERRLAELHYALHGIDGYYGTDTFEAVLAFQKVNGLPRTGRVEPWLWRRLARASVPRATRGGDYIEVDKTRQVLFGRAGRHRDAGRPRLDRRDRQHAARHLARLPQGRRLGLGALVPDVLHGRLRDPRLPVRARVSRPLTAACGCRCGSRRRLFRANGLRHDGGRAPTDRRPTPTTRRSRSCASSSRPTT